MNMPWQFKLFCATWGMLFLVAGVLFVIAAVLSAAHAQVVYFSSPPNTLVNGTTTNAILVMGNYNRIVSDGNTAYSNFEAAISAIGGAPTPSGAVVGFNLSTCPTGWKASDGTSGTVDLRGYFPVITGGVGADTAVGTVVQDQMLAHTHEVAGGYIASLSGGGLAKWSASGVGINNAFGGVGVGAPISGSFGSETRPRNVALLYCQKT
jgi:hypothetical protein